MNGPAGAELVNTPRVKPHLELLLVQVLPLLPLRLQGLNMVEEICQDGLEGDFLLILLLHDLLATIATFFHLACPHHMAGRMLLKYVTVTKFEGSVGKATKTNKTRTETALSGSSRLTGWDRLWPWRCAGSSRRHMQSRNTTQAMQGSSSIT